MNPLTIAVGAGTLPFLERAVVSRYFARYVVVAAVLIIAILLLQKKGESK